MTTTIGKRQVKEKKLVIENLKRMPIIEVACNKSGISRATFYRWKEQDAEFSQAAEKAQVEGEALVGDIAVSKIVKEINNDNLTAAIYWLNHRDPRFSNKFEVTARLKSDNETLTPDQETLVIKALKLAALLPSAIQEASDTRNDEKEDINQ